VSEYRAQAIASASSRLEASTAEAAYPPVRGWPIGRTL